MKKFYITFGQKYRDEPHPTHGDIIHPDGYVVIHAEDYEKARRIAFTTFGDAWARCYDESDLDPGYFPRGVLFEIGGADDRS